MLNQICEEPRRLFGEYEISFMPKPVAWTIASGARRTARAS